MTVDQWVTLVVGISGAVSPVVVAIVRRLGKSQGTTQETPPEE